MYLGSDASALAPFTRRICYLEEDDWAGISASDVKVYNAGRVVERPVTQSALSGALVGKGNTTYPIALEGALKLKEISTPRVMQPAK